MIVMHACDNPPCFLYGHLRLGTQADNMADMAAKGRRRDKAKLTAAEVAEIRWLLTAGMTQRSIGERYGVARSTVGHIKSGATWNLR